MGEEKNSNMVAICNSKIWAAIAICSHCFIDLLFGIGHNSHLPRIHFGFDIERFHLAK